MMKYIALITVFLLLGCSNTMVETSEKNDNGEPTIKSQFIDSRLEMAKIIKITHGIPISISVAVAHIASDGGQSEIAMEANNEFGIKCWETIDDINTCYQTGGKLHGEPIQYWRSYDSYIQSWMDFGQLLSTSDRYKSLFELDPLEYSHWAYGLQRCGYTVNPRYGDLIIDVILLNGLHKYDKIE